jgi:hypothetical protein
MAVSSGIIEDRFALRILVARTNRSGMMKQAASNVSAAFNTALNLPSGAALVTEYSGCRREVDVRCTNT